MALVINTNSLSLLTQNSLSKSRDSLSSSIQRLSSGLRINSAKDDAAGQAIANRMTAQINGIAQSKRNVADGISLAQTTEGALGEITNNLQRVRELTVQALNGTNSTTDLLSIQEEIGQRMAEIDRISAQTQFNGIKVLASDRTVPLQVGANSSDTLNLHLSAINTTTIGLENFSVLNKISTSEVTTTASDAADVINPGAPQSMTLASFTSVVDPVFHNSAYSSISLKKDSISKQYYIEVEYQDSSVGYYKAGFDPSTAKMLSVSSTPTAITNPVGAPTTGTNTLVYDSKNDQYYIKNDQGAGSVSYYAATATKNVSTGVISVTDVSATAAAFPETTTVETVEPATANPLATLDNAIAQVDSQRGRLGAMQNRLESTVNNLSTTSMNLSGARSRIEDADYALEVSNMTHSQILQQAGTSVLAQANQTSQNVLSLLR